MLSPEGGGIRFGHYLLLRRLARGGMAEVFLAQQKGLEGFDRRVAIKRILPHLAGATDFIRMFLSEAKLAAQLTHPNIVHIYEFGKHDGDYFLAMEYVDGVHAGDIYELGVKGDRLPPALVARMGADAAIALHHAHELRGSDGKPLGLVHRDVSPANIMISFDGVVKLCDFGIAKAAALGEQLTTPGQVKGKYAYMSPEQTIGAPVDGRSDVFSLAIVMWEMLACKPIVSRGDPVGAMRAIRDGTLPRISKAAPDTPRALADAIDWALTNQRDERASALELAQALEAYIKASPDVANALEMGTWIRGRFSRSTTPSPDRGERTEAAQDTPPAKTVASGVSHQRATWDESEPFDNRETVNLGAEEIDDRTKALDTNRRRSSPAHAAPPDPHAFDADDRTKALDTNRRRTPDPDHTTPAERQRFDADDPFGNDESTNAIDAYPRDGRRPAPPAPTTLDDAATPRDESPFLGARGASPPPFRNPPTSPPPFGASAPGSSPGARAPGTTKPPPFGASAPGSSPGRAPGTTSPPPFGSSAPASSPGTRPPGARSPTNRPVAGLPPPRRIHDSRAPSPPVNALGVSPPVASPASRDAVHADDETRPVGHIPTSFASTLSAPVEGTVGPNPSAPLRLDSTGSDPSWQAPRPGTPQPYASDAHSAIASILGPRRTYVIGMVSLAVISFVIALAARTCASDPPPSKPAGAATRSSDR